MSLTKNDKKIIKIIVLIATIILLLLVTIGCISLIYWIIHYVNHDYRIVGTTINSFILVDKLTTKNDIMYDAVFKGLMMVFMIGMVFLCVIPCIFGIGFYIYANTRLNRIKPFYCALCMFCCIIVMTLSLLLSAIPFL